jgi:hypothetical protein
MSNVVIVFSFLRKAPPQETEATHFYLRSLSTCTPSTSVTPCPSSKLVDAEPLADP